MSQFLKHLLTLYKEKKINQDIALGLIEEYKKSHNTQEKQKLAATSAQKIAIVGVAVRMPFANSPGQFWENLTLGKDCIRTFPDSRKKDIDPIAEKIPSHQFSSENKYWPAGFLDEVDKFDNEFFEILPAEAKIMDPQQRIFLELACEAFENAGYTRKKLRNSNTGIFLGDVVNEYRKIISSVTASAVVGNISPFITSRVSYFYDLHGPTLNISTTCSTSLVAVHAACQSLLQNECQLALVGAINLRLFPFALKDDPVDALGITTPDLCCRAFDNAANGIVRGEGGAALVLKPYDQAVNDNDHIYAVILGSAVNNDGHSSSVGAPNPLAQEKLLKTAWEKSKIDPRTINYIEAHGTGTKIGDPIEINGISRAFASYTQDRQFCGIGSIKTNLGHLTGGASGLAGLVKTILAIKHKKIPPTLHFSSPNELINFADTPVYVVDRLSPWPLLETPRRAGVSAFGFNGTNCHLVLEEAPEQTLQSDSRQHSNQEFILVVSHRTEKGLRTMLEQLKAHFEKDLISNSIADVCYTLAVCRDHFSERAAIIGHSLADIHSKIDKLLTLPIITKSIVSFNSNIIQANLAQESNDNTIQDIALKYCLATYDWSSYYQGSYIKVLLPSYAFEKKRFWIEETGYHNEDNEYCLNYSKISMDPKAPRVSSDIESQLINIYQEVMGLKDIKTSDSFFDLGGDSLLGIDLINEIHKTFNKKLSYNDLFANPKISDLMALLGIKTTQAYDEIQLLPQQESYVLSFGQRRLWILHQMQDNPIAYNMYEAFDFNVRLDIPAFKKALDGMISRHSAFRTVFSNMDGQPVQKILPNASFNLTIVDLQNDPNSDAAVIKHLDTFKLQPFDLETGPLAKALLIRASAAKSIFFFMVHHIISDGWSIRVLIQDLLKTYQAYAFNQPAQFIPLRIQYTDYAAWQHHTLSQERFCQLELFWLQKFSGNLPICEILGDRQRPAVFHFEGSRKLFVVPANITQNLSTLALQQNATLFMALLSSIYVFINRYSGQQDLIVGTPVSGRSHFDLKHIVGFFVNTLALRSTINPDESFSQLLSQVKKDVLDAFEHQDYPFDSLIDKLKLDRDTSRSPLFNINVAFQNFELNEEAQQVMKNLDVQHHELPHHSCKWDLEFEFIKQANGNLNCYVEYYEGIYSRNMVESMIENYLVLLNSIVITPRVPISSLQMPLVSKNIIECPSSSYCVNSTPECLHTVFERCVVQYPQAPAVKHLGNSISYEELNQQANQLANFLFHEKKLSKEERVGIYMQNSIETIIAILATLKAGGTYVPMDIKAPLERLKTIVDQADIRIVLSKKESLSLLNKLQWTCTKLTSYICLDTLDISAAVEQQNPALMDEKLWNQVAAEGNDQITTSGWVSSYTGKSFTTVEMEEYATNILTKLKPHLSTQDSILEIGCGSGLTLFKLASHVKNYTGTDLSSTVLKINQTKAENEYVHNVDFKHCEAHQIASAIQRFNSYKIIILNSVIHCFPGLNYLKQVLQQAISLCADQGIIFLGDLMDQDLKTKLESSMLEFKNLHRQDGVRTKTDWNNELFISKQFLNDLQIDFPAIHKIEFSQKLHTIENELTKFRFDAILHIDKKQPFANNKAKSKAQHGTADYKNMPIANLELPISPNSLAYIIFTSGSTGLPKGVMVEHHTVKHYIDWAIHAYFKETSEKPCFPFYSPLSFDLTVTSIFSPLFTGSFMRVYNGEFDEILNGLQKNGDCNILKLTPTHLSMILATKKVPNNIRKYIVGGEALFSSMVNELHNLAQAPLEIYNEYGPTEATVGCIVYENRQIENSFKLLPIGKPISNAKIHILNSQLGSVPIGGLGEICIGGNCLARGYLHNPQLTNEKFVSDPFSKSSERLYRTGDIGRLLPNGLLEYIGRSDRQVKIKGYRIELNEVEATFCKHSSLTSAAICVKQDSRGEVICGYYCSKTPITSTELRDFMLQELPEYMVPSFFMQLDKMPLSNNGKIDYSHLPEPFIDLHKQIVKPQNVTQKLLSSIWAHVLGIVENQISIEDDFFELGGDSIIAMRILPKLSSLGIILSIKEIFQFRTIARISAHLSLKECVSPISIPQMEISGTLPLTPIQKWFFEMDQPYPHYFHMAYLFQIPASTDELLLEKAINKCLEHHDILRANYFTEEQKITQNICHYSESNFSIVKVDLHDLTDAEQKIQIIDITKELQNQSKLSCGPLFITAIFDLGAGGKKLFIAMHHLIIDGVSWRYLVEDIELLYRSNLQASLPLKTHSFVSWANELVNYARDTSLNIDYWKNIELKNLPSIIKKHKSSSLVKDFSEAILTIDPSLTQILLSSIHSTLNTNVNDLLVSALLLSLSDIFNIRRLLINHEGHGRHPINGLDVSRTAGWFTTIYPILLEKQSTVIDTLINVRDTLRMLSELDINFGLARYHQNNLHLQQITPEVLFNYFGRIGADLMNEDPMRLLSSCAQEIGPTSHPNNKMPHFLEVNAIAMENQLRISIMYDTNAFELKTMQRWISLFEEKINQIVITIQNIKETT